MDLLDYYCPTATATTTTETLAYGLGRGARNLTTVTSKVPDIMNPFKAIFAVTAAWGGIAAIVNYRKYKQGKITKKQAFSGAANEGVGLGIAATLGSIASNAVLTTSALTVASTSVLPFVVGVAVTAGTKTIWDCKTKGKGECYYEEPKIAAEKTT